VSLQDANPPHTWLIKGSLENYV